MAYRVLDLDKMHLKCIPHVKTQSLSLSGDASLSTYFGGIRPANSKCNFICFCFPKRGKRSHLFEAKRLLVQGYDVVSIETRNRVHPSGENGGCHYLKKGTNSCTGKHEDK